MGHFVAFWAPYFFRMHFPGSSPVLQQLSTDHAAAMCKLQLHFSLKQVVFLAVEGVSGAFG